jgi:hypothetical protein
MEITMPWTKTTREQYRRDHLRYASDTTDAEWLLRLFSCRVHAASGVLAKLICGR